VTDSVETDASELVATQLPAAADVASAEVTPARRVALASSLLAGLIAGVPTLVLYWRTLLPDVAFWDTAEFQAIGPVLGIAHPTGYPAYTLAAWIASVVLQPFGNEALRANLMSAIFVAVGVALVAGTVTRLTGRVVVGAATGIALAVTAQAWSIGLRADPHALHLMLAALLLALLVTWHNRVQEAAPGSSDKWLIAAAATFGVSLANHGLTYLLAPGIAIFVLMVQPRILKQWRLILACVAALAITTVALYAYLPIRSAMNPPLDYANPQTLEGFRYVVFAEQFRGTFQALPDVATAIRTIATVTFTQLGLFAVLAIVGVFSTALRRPALMVLLVAWFAVNWFFALGYLNADIGRYYLVPLMCAAVLGGLGASAIVDWASRLLEGLRRGPALLGAAAAVVLIVPLALVIPDRFTTVDSSKEVAGRMWLASVTRQLPPDSVVVSWWSYSTTLWYGQFVEHLRPDVTVIDDSTIVQQNLGSVKDVINSYLGERPVYLIRTSYDMPMYEQMYVLDPLPGVAGAPVYEVQGMKA
jgi:hypothetical protein